MKIKDLIEHLKTLDPEKTLLITNNYWMYTNPIGVEDICPGEKTSIYDDRYRDKKSDYYVIEV